MSDTITPDELLGGGDDEHDPELTILIHATEYMLESDSRAQERLMFYLAHRFFPDGTFQTQRITLVHNPVTPAIQ